MKASTFQENRIKLCLSQDEMAHKLFVSRRTIINYETGKSKIPNHRLDKINEVFKNLTTKSELFLDKRVTPKSKMSDEKIIAMAIKKDLMPIFRNLTTVIEELKKEISNITNQITILNKKIQL